MAITPTYPGVYIEELPSFSHSVTAAPTSVTVFIGYTHPFKTRQFGTAVEIFSFADYQANFGGFFSFAPWLPNYVGNAVFQFFQNGGADAWVIGLRPKGYLDATGQPVTDGAGNDMTLSAASVAITVTPATVTLTAQVPGGVDPASNNADVATPTVVQLANVRPDANGNQDAVADIIISYGPQVETYRGVLAANIVTTLAQSALVGVTVTNGPPATYPAAGTFSLAYQTAPPANSTLVYPGDYGGVFLTGASLDVDVPVFNLMVLPGISPVDNQQSAVLSEALAFCEQKRAFFIMDAPPNATTSPVSPPPEQTPAGTPAQIDMGAFWKNHTPPVSANGAIYFPYLETIDPLTQQRYVSPPSGFVAGIFAREDASVSVGKAPAGLETTIKGTSGVVAWGRMTDMQQGPLNNDGVNCLRDFPGIGTVVFGARTLVTSNTAFDQWKYVPVRRTALFIEQSLYGSLGWAVFQPNDTPLWNALTQEVNAFMLTLFRQGNYFQGTTPSEAFLVQCDGTTTTQADITAGRVNILVGFAPLKPAEFVVIQITQLAGQTQT